MGCCSIDWHLANTDKPYVRATRYDNRVVFISRLLTNFTATVRLKSCLRTTKKYRHKWVVPNKPIKRLRQRRGALRREGAIADLRFPPASATANKRLKRGDSEPFILVDFGNHFKMVEPNLARRNYRAVPTNIRTLAPLHALGAHIEEDELRGRLLVAPIRATKRVRFEDDEEEEEEEEPPSRKRLRLV